MTKNCWSGAAIGDDVSGDSQSLRISLEWVRWMVRNSQMLKIYDGSPSPESKKNIWLWLTVCHGKSQFLIGKLEFLWAIYTMAMLNKQRVSSFFICPVICVQFFWGGLPSTHFRTNRYHAVRYLFHYLHCIPTVVGFKPVSLLVKSHWEPDDVPIKLLET